MSKQTATLILNGIVIVGLLALVAFGKTTLEQAIAGVALILVPSAAPEALKKLRDAVAAQKPPRGPSSLGVVLLFVCVFPLTGCGYLHAQKIEAENAYLAKHLKCIDDQPAPPKGATQAQKDAFDAAVNDCRRKVREEFQIENAQANRTRPPPQPSVR